MNPVHVNMVTVAFIAMLISIEILISIISAFLAPKIKFLGEFSG
jgi:hypothetical protein